MLFFKLSQLLGFGQMGVKSEQLLAILVDTMLFINDEAHIQLGGWFDLVQATIEAYH